MVVFEGSRPTEDKVSAMTRGMNGTYCFWDDLSRSEQARILYPNNFFSRLFHIKTIKKTSEEEKLLDAVEKEKQRIRMGLIYSVNDEHTHIDNEEEKMYAHRIETIVNRNAYNRFTVNKFKHSYTWHNGEWEYTGGHSIGIMTI